MIIIWLYFAATLVMLRLGLDILITKKVSLHVWKRFFRYDLAFATGKPAQVVGFVIVIFSLVFLLDALLSIINTKLKLGMFYLFCGGAVILLFAINVVLRKQIK